MSEFKKNLIKASEELDNKWTHVHILRNSVRDALESCNVIAFLEYRTRLDFQINEYVKYLNGIVTDVDPPPSQRDLTASKAELTEREREAERRRHASFNGYVREDD